MSTFLDTLTEEPAVLDWPDVLSPHLSPAQVGDYLLCEEKYRLSRIKKLPQRSNAKLVIGTADTEANAANMRSVIDTREMLSLGDVEIRAAEAFDNRVESEGGSKEVDWEDATEGAAKDKAIQVAGVYRETVAPSVKPIAVEQPISFEVAGAPPTIGRADVVEERQVVEKKTAASLTRQIQPWWKPQALIYAAALNRPVAFHVTTKAAAPKVTTPETDEYLLQPVERLQAEAVVGSVADGLRMQVATLGPDEPWAPSGLTHGWACKLCAYRTSGACVYWRKTV